MFWLSVRRDPTAWARRVAGSRSRLVFCISSICGYAVLLIGMEYLTLTAYYQYGVDGDKWAIFARFLAVGFACFIMVLAWFPIELVVILRGVIRDLEKVPSNSERQATAEK